MATTQIEKLLVSLEARTKEYEKALARAHGQTVTQMRKIEREAEGFSSRFDRKLGAIGISMKAALAGAATAAVAAFATIARNAVSDAAKIGDLADKIGATTDAVQELAYGAVQADMGFEELSGGLLKFSKAMGEARNGSGDLLKLFEANGFDQAAVRAMSFSQALAVVADMVKNAATEQDALLVSLEAFGRGAGDQFLEMLTKGSAGLRENANAAREASSIIDAELIRKAQEWDDKWAASMQSMKASALDFILNTAREIETLSNAWDSFVNSRTGSAATGFPRFGGSAISGPAGVPLDPSLRGRAAASTLSAGGKGDMLGGRTTVIPDAQKERDLAEAKRDQAKADREAARAEDDRAKAAQDRFDTLRQTINDNAKASIAITEELNDQKLEQMRAVEDSMRSLAEIGLDAFERIAFGGEKLKTVLSDLVKSLASAALQAAILGQGPLAGLFGGGGGIIGGLFSGGIASLYHGGGVVGSSGAKRRVSPLTFAGAGRFHNGGMPGLRSGEVAAILQKGETVLPRGHGAGGFSLKFSPVIDARGADASAIARLERQLADQARNMERNVKNIIATESARSPRFLQ